MQKNNASNGKDETINTDMLDDKKSLLAFKCLDEYLDSKGRNNQRSSWIIGGVESDGSRQTTPVPSPKITAAAPVLFRDSFVLEDIFFTPDNSQTPATTPNASRENLSHSSSVGSIVRANYTPSEPVPIPIINPNAAIRGKLNICFNGLGNSGPVIDGTSSSVPVVNTRVGGTKPRRRSTQKIG